VHQKVVDLRLGNEQALHANDESSDERRCGGILQILQPSEPARRASDPVGRVFRFPIVCCSDELIEQNKESLDITWLRDEGLAGFEMSHTKTNVAETFGT
jgi:hypothetical protein